MINLILCGGNGTRLWPLSRTLFPKQFVKLFENKSLFQKTVLRNTELCYEQMIVSNAEQYFLAVDQLHDLGINHARYLLEPVGRNTAPAIALACMSLNDNAIVFVTPSDHLVRNHANYRQAVARAKELAAEGYLVTFGMQPTHVETGFGYIEAEGENVLAFHEKPTQKIAEQYCDSGKHFWNSGMFCFKVTTYLQELKRYAPDIYESCAQACSNIQCSGDFTRIKHEDMINIPEDSIDYAVMEKSDKVKMVVADFGWSDVGSFDSLDEELEKDENGNTKCDRLYTLDAKNNFVYSKERAVALTDVEDLIVVDTGDALLISKKGNSQKVKNVVSILKEHEKNLHYLHLTVHRPWGTYTVLEDEERYKIKRIVVKPGKRLSLQKHFHRNEHWIVVSGTAIVRVGNDETIVRANESTHIPMGVLHRLENPGKIDLVLIEVQVGEYTDEDDIVRIDDDFDRH